MYIAFSRIYLYVHYKWERESHTFHLLSPISLSSCARIPNFAIVHLCVCVCEFSGININTYACLLRQKFCVIIGKRSPIPVFHSMEYISTLYIEFYPIKHCVQIFLRSYDREVRWGFNSRLVGSLCMHIGTHTRYLWAEDLYFSPPALYSNTYFKYLYSFIP